MKFTHHINAFWKHIALAECCETNEGKCLLVGHKYSADQCNKARASHIAKARVALIAAEACLKKGLK